MLQVLQHQKSGEIIVEDLPVPLCPENGILVRTYYSLISAGTEKTSVENAKASLLERAKRQPEEVKKVIDFVKKEGLFSTIDRVKNKLESYKTLGYSASGVVVETKCTEFSVGDFVACGGAGYATHSEYIAVPKNLAVKVPEAVNMQESAWATVGSIALQGIRQAKLNLGENCAVIGLGLLGQLTIQLLKANGVKVLGMDINEKLFEVAQKSGCDKVLLSSEENLATALAFTNGYGLDAVIICASTSSNQPTELALKLARKKGRIVVVGAVPMNIPRNPFYEKELEFTISCSYGAGRYDPIYEEQGIDYPYAYVRWTENRNMLAFLDLISEKKINLAHLTTHIFPIEKAKEAYELITENKDFYLGILFQYNVAKEEAKPSKTTILATKDVIQSTKESLRIGVIGVGTFAQGHLLPALQKSSANIIAICDLNPANSYSVAKRYGAKFCSTDANDIIRNTEVDMIFCASRHSSHFDIVMEAMKMGKPVFVEKPLCVNEEQLSQIKTVHKETNGKVMVGFNRRFSRAFTLIKEFFVNRTEPMNIIYRVNAGAIPLNHWLYLPEEGGGRTIGEMCHFIDIFLFLTNSFPKKLVASSISSQSNTISDRENVSVAINFADGSLATLLYYTNGDTSYPKEYCEVSCEKSLAIMNNFEKVELIRQGKKREYKLDGKKGINEEVSIVLKNIKEGKPMPISFEEIEAVTKTTFYIHKSLEKQEIIEY